MQALQHREDIALHWFDPFGTTGINNLCSYPPRQLARNRIVFWDQEPLRQSDIEKFVPAFQKDYHGPITFVVSDDNPMLLEELKQTWQIDSEYYFFHGWAALDWYRGYNFTYLGEPWHQRHIDTAVFCPNNIIGGERLHRVDFFGELAKRDLIKSNKISFPAHCPYEQTSAHDLLSSRGYHVDLELPRIIDRIINNAQQSHSIDFWSQAQSCFAHVVTETVYSGDRRHLTEKTFKPLVMQQPFLLVAPRQSLAYLRSYGFLTFGSIWDESYDDLPDDQRLCAVADVVKEISSWDQRTRDRKQRDVAHIVRHNYGWFYQEFAHTLWREISGLISRLHDIPVF